MGNDILIYLLMCYGVMLSVAVCGGGMSAGCNTVPTVLLVQEMDGHEMHHNIVSSSQPGDSLQDGKALLVTSLDLCRAI